MAILKSFLPPPQALASTSLKAPATQTLHGRKVFSLQGLAAWGTNNRHTSFHIVCPSSVPIYIWPQISNYATWQSIVTPLPSGSIIIYLFSKFGAFLVSFPLEGKPVTWCPAISSCSLFYVHFRHLFLDRDRQTAHRQSPLSGISAKIPMPTSQGATLQ